MNINKILQKDILNFASSLDENNMFKYNYLECTGDCGISIIDEEIHIIELIEKCSEYMKNNFNVDIENFNTITKIFKNNVEIKSFLGGTQLGSFLNACYWVENEYNK